MADAVDHCHFCAGHLLKQFRVGRRDNCVACAENGEQRRNQLKRCDPLIRRFGVAMSNAFLVGRAKSCVSELFKVSDEFFRDGEARSKTLS